ncbi:hypothetical protein KP509_12G081900 [Ceratopteris richardii]|uniref:Uncharacterized protein n=1 Tax=Ceratopteris richardii TaxID=49495 RepID=A0A8T2TR99_CERRI|nr:hypothetical protein KP509_12G081900 [Ceratopteris richardii]
MASNEEAGGCHHEIPLEDIHKLRGVAQEQSMNAIFSAQQRYQNAISDSSRDSIDEAINHAKGQLDEKDKDSLEGGQEGKATGEAK